MTGERISRFSQITALLFLAASIFWFSIVLLQQGDLLLVLPGIVSLFSAVLIFMRKKVIVLRSIALAAGLYNLLIFAYHAYSAFSLIGSGFTSFAYLAIFGYSLGTATFLFLLLKVQSDSDVFRLS
ncbi:MAG: hypothetical protein QF812_00470 [Nitrososphaerales archaeon]|jgi:hypothetical protein|nr:hypothetical protein [Nitrososphaerales archaeon]|tara:strand:+ start:2403 stop:2780 length:378 start_codon:yes stop_codon:yes gene_type:complete